MILSIFSQNITLTEQGASSLWLALPPSAIAHMTEAAAADYTFSSDGTASPSHCLLLPPFPLASTCSKHRAVSWFYLLGFSSSFMLFPLFFPALYFLCFPSAVPSLFFLFTPWIYTLSLSLLSNCCLSPSSQCVLPPTVYCHPACISTNPLVLTDSRRQFACQH